MTTTATPISGTERITNLDTVRGIATLGILVMNAVCSPVLLVMRRRSARTLFIAGGACIALGAMLIGVGLFRAEIIQGQKPAAFYRRMARVGFGIGLPLSVLGVLIHATNDWSGDGALIGAVPNILATIPFALGYVALITLWNQRAETRWHQRARAVGRMALTQTLIGLLVLDGIFDFGSLSRSQIFVFIVAVWALQIAWSEPWLRHFRFGPFEWLWRIATYRRIQPIRD